VLTAVKVKEEEDPAVDLLSCLDGFSVTLDTDSNVIYVTENVGTYLGLSQVDLLGQDFHDYVHPCDHSKLNSLTLGSDTNGQEVEISVRVKCTVTERGRMTNLKQATYKPIKLSGKTHCLSGTRSAGLKGPIFLGLATPVVEREMVLDQSGVFTSKHRVDMKCVETDPWFTSVGGYLSQTLAGMSFYELVHALDITHVQESFLNLLDHGQVQTHPYRLLCHGGGYVWVQSQACLNRSRRGNSNMQEVTCGHYQLSEVINRDHLESVIQMKDQNIIYNLSSQLQRSKPIKQSIGLDLDINKQIIVAPERKQLKDKTISCAINGHKPLVVDNDMREVHASASLTVKCCEAEFGPTHVSQSEPETFQAQSVDLAASTECIFNTKETAFEALELQQKTSPVRDMHGEVNFWEAAFIKELFSNLTGLENLAPHSGDQPILLNTDNYKQGTPTGDPLPLDELIYLEFDESSEYFGDVGVGPFSKKDEFIKPTETTEDVCWWSDKNNADLTEPLSAKPTHNQTFGNKAGCDVFHSNLKTFSSTQADLTMTNIVLEHDGRQSEHRKEEIVAWPKIKPAKKKDPMFSPYNEDLCNVSILTAEEDGIYTSPQEIGCSNSTGFWPGKLKQLDVSPPHSSLNDLLVRKKYFEEEFKEISDVQNPNFLDPKTSKFMQQNRGLVGNKHLKQEFHDLLVKEPNEKEKGVQVKDDYNINDAFDNMITLPQSYLHVTKKIKLDPDNSSCSLLHKQIKLYHANENVF